MQQPSWARTLHIPQAAAQRLTCGGAEPLLRLETHQISPLPSIWVRWRLLVFGFVFTDSFFWVLSSLVFRLSDTDPYSNCTVTPVQCFLQLHFFLGCLISEALLSHCLSSGLLTVLATRVLAPLQLPSPSNFCL